MDLEMRRAMMELHEQNCIREYGFFVHLVPTGDVHGQCNYHTHGVFDTFGHLDFQIVLPVPQNVVGALFHMLVNEVKSGKKFEAGVEYYGMVVDPKMPTVFKLVWEQGRQVLRMLIPDPKGVVPGQEGCDPGYDIQWI